MSFNFKIEFRISEDEKKLIKEQSEKSGLTVSEYCRRAALNKNITQIFSKEQEELYKNLIVYHNNFTRISNMIKNKDSNTFKEINLLIEFFKSEIKNFLHDRKR